MLISVAPSPGLFAEVARQGCALYCEQLARSVLGFLAEYRFDGVEIDWPDAVERWTDFKLVLRAIGAPLARAGYTLALSIGAENPADREIASIVDLIVLRSWRDGLGRGDREGESLAALHPAPLTYVARNVERWIVRVGAEETSKIILSVPIFGQGYTLKFSNATDAGASVIGPGREGPYTKRKDGRLAYYEVGERDAACLKTLVRHIVTYRRRRIRQ